MNTGRNNWCYKRTCATVRGVVQDSSLARSGSSTRVAPGQLQMAFTLGLVLRGFSPFLGLPRVIQMSIGAGAESGG